MHVELILDTSEFLIFTSPNVHILHYSLPIMHIIDLVTTVTTMTARVFRVRENLERVEAPASVR